MAKPTYELRFSYETIATVMHIADCLFDIGGCVSSVCYSMIPREWTHHIIRCTLSQLCIATKEPLPLDGLILLHFLSDNLCARIWFDDAQYVVVDILLGPSFINHFIRGMFPSERNVVPWLSQSFVILARTKSRRIVVHRITFHTSQIAWMIKAKTTILPTTLFVSH